MDHLCTEHEVEALLCSDDLKMAEFIEKVTRDEDVEVCDSSAEALPNVEAEWHKRVVYDSNTDSMVDKLTVAKWINQKTPLTITKSGDRTRRVASVPKFSSGKRAGHENAIERSFYHGVGAIDFPEDDEAMKSGDCAMMLVEVLARSSMEQITPYSHLE